MKQRTMEKALGGVALEEISLSKNIEQIHFETTLPIQQLAIQAVEEVGPRVYELVGLKDELRFFVLGCQGMGDNSQQQVAQLMHDKVSESPEKKPDFILFLGDNIYKFGAKDPQDLGFIKYFYNIYHKSELGSIKGIPGFTILGNHDENRHKQSFLAPNWPHGKAAGLNQTAHTYIPQAYSAKIFNSVAELKKLFSQEKLSCNELPLWNMPYYFYSLIAGKLQFFCLNSNSLVKDYLELKLAESDKNKLQDLTRKGTNQTLWLRENWQKARDAGRTIALALHHPFKTQGVRAFRNFYDTKQYLSYDDVKNLNGILHSNTESYNELLALIFENEGMQPDFVLAAHDHNMSFFKDEKLCQIGAGGGGGKLQRRQSFKDQLNTGCFLSNLGFVSVSCPIEHPKEMVFEFFTTAHHHMKFSLDSRFPKREPTEDETLETFREIVLQASDAYLLSLHPAQDPTKTSDESYFQYLGHLTSNIYHQISHLFQREVPSDIDLIQDLLAYFHQPKLEFLSEVKNYFCWLVEQLEEKNGTGFMHFFNLTFDQSPSFAASEKLRGLREDINTVLCHMPNLSLHLAN